MKTGAWVSSMEIGYTDSSLRFKRDHCARCQAVKNFVCGGGPVIWRAVNGIKTCAKYCLRLGPNVAAGVCSAICAVVLGFGCYLSSADACDYWCD